VNRLLVFYCREGFRNFQTLYLAVEKEGKEKGRIEGKEEKGKEGRVCIG